MALEIADKRDGAFALLWIDLETTGTNEDLDSIIEIGAIMTDFNLNRIGKDDFDIVVDPDPYALGLMMKERAVFEMHNENGLLGEIIANKGVTMDIAQMEMKRWMDSCVNDRKHRGPISKFRFVLAGSGVGHFDRRFIRAQMPDVEQLLTYQMIDIGMIRRFMKYCDIQLPAPPDPGNKNHRALEDIRLHLAEARGYQTMFRECLGDAAVVPAATV